MPLSLRQTTAPTTTPLSIQDVQRHLREVNEDEGTVATLNRLIELATSEAERLTWRQLINATWAYRLDGFSTDEIVLPRPPLVSVTSLQYVDPAGATQTLAAGDYTVDIYTDPGRILLGYGKTWPTTRDVENAVTITYVAGYGAAASAVPIGIRHAMLLLIGHWFENREEIVFETFIPKQLPYGAIELLLGYKARGVIAEELGT